MLMERTKFVDILHHGRRILASNVGFVYQKYNVKNKIRISSQSNAPICVSYIS